LTATWIVALGASYLLGAVPSGLLLSKWLVHRDPREFGSGNTGATNAMRTGGKLVGALTLLADIAKGALPVAVARYAQLPEAGVASIAMAAFLGHLFPIYLRFKGGKGVATMLGVLLPWQPLIAVIGIIFWYVMLKVSRYVSVASIAAALALPLLMWWLDRPAPAEVSAVAIALLVTIKHASNIQRLIAGCEPAIRS